MLDLSISFGEVMNRHHLLRRSKVSHDMYLSEV